MMREEISQIWKFPDGSKWVITLPGWYWIAYERSVKPDEYLMDAIPGYGGFKEEILKANERNVASAKRKGWTFPDDESIIATTMQLIRIRHRLRMKKTRANQNGFEDIPYYAKHKTD